MPLWKSSKVFRIYQLKCHYDILPLALLEMVIHDFFSHYPKKTDIWINKIMVYSQYIISITTFWKMSLFHICERAWWFSINLNIVKLIKIFQLRELGRWIQISIDFWNQNAIFIFNINSSKNVNDKHTPHKIDAIWSRSSSLQRKLLKHTEQWYLRNICDICNFRYNSLLYSDSQRAAWKKLYFFKENRYVNFLI